MATQTEVASHLDLSQPAVSQLARAGVLPASGKRGGLDLDGCRVAYIRHLRETAAGRAARDTDALDLVAERARLAAAQAEAQERRNLHDRGRLIDFQTVDHAVRATLTTVVSRLERVGATVANGDHKLRVRIETAVHDAMEDIAATDAVEMLMASAGPAPLNDDGGD